jgi:two-component system sensor histidine kinase TctE
MSWRNRSLRRRLVIWLLTPLFLIFMAMLAESYSSVGRSADKAYDRSLLGSALAIAERVVAIDGELEVDLPYVALEMLTSTAQDRVFYRVTGPNDVFITGYRDLPPAPSGLAVEDDRPLFHDVVYRGEDVRVVTLSRPIIDRSLSGRFQVQVAETVSGRELLTREILTGAAARQLLLIAVAGLMTWFGIGRALKPLNRLQQAIRRRSPSDLGPLRQDVPKEVRHLVEAINQLMDRLKVNIETMQRFIADASHQLRTPLAALQTQTESALRDRDPDSLRRSLLRLNASTRRTSRLASQLLAIAQVSPEPGARPPKEPLDLARLAAEVTREWVPAALDRNVDLGFEAPRGPAVVLGQAVLLGELLKNLIDNALRHAPDGGHVTVRAAGAGSSVDLEVEDDGPGVPRDQRARVLERFYRVPGDKTEGCGLGLAIVKEIAETHGARVTLASGNGERGLLVRVSFPAHAAAEAEGRVEQAA